MIQLDEGLEKEIRRLGKETFPHECCGFLVGTDAPSGKIVEEAIPAENERADSPHNRYEISSDNFREVESRAKSKGRSLIGFFHSHPDAPARPSEYDREHAWPWYSYLILAVEKGQPKALTSWVLRDDRSCFDPEEIQRMVLDHADRS